MAACYLCALIAWAATTTLMYSLYVQAKLEKMVLMNGLVNYIGFGLSNPIVVYIIRKSNLKRAIILGFLGIGIE